jgi:predicted GNAT family acetyltransferase
VTSSPEGQGIDVRDNAERHRFEVYLDGGLAGFATYEIRPGAIAIMHTEIDPAFEGRGLGTAVARGALDSARGGGLDVLPYCPFTNEFIKRHREYLDLVPATKRERFGLPPVS